MTYRLLPLIFILLLLVPVVAQEEQVTVPDVTGLTVPQAAAELNKAGLRLGVETAFGWTAETGLQENTISEQSIEPGEQVARGSTVDLTVLRSTNALLVYDDNDITLVNQSGGEITLSGLIFSTPDGSAVFNALDWGGAVGAGDCTQLWSVARNGAKEVEGCGNINWRTTTNPAAHFWTGVNGATQFAVVQNGVQRAVCDIAPAGSCAFYLAGDAALDATEHVYMAYTVDKFVLVNNTDDTWMPLAGFTIVDSRGGIIQLTSPVAYGDIVGNTELLAPLQCIYLRNKAEGKAPQTCEPIAEVALKLDFIFWMEAFAVTSLTDGEQRLCPAATPGKLTLCILPR